MARKELVMSEHPFWQTVLQEGGCGPKVVEIEMTTKAEINGRTARKEIALFDAIHAEILGEKDAEKAKVRNRRRANRKHPENKQERMRKAHNRLERKYGYFSEDGGLVHRGFVTGELYADGKIRVAEQIARNDWELEYAENEKARINAEIDALNEWLVWA